MAIGTTAAILGSAAIGAGASIAASRSQRKSAEAARRDVRESEARARADVQPFAQAGRQVLNPLVDFVSTGPETELERTAGFQDIQESAAAAGKLRSGGTLKALTEFNNMLNARRRRERFNELFNVAALGSNAASQQATNTLNAGGASADLLTQAGNARAAGIIGAGNAGQNALTNFAFLNLLRSQNSGN